MTCPVCGDTGEVLTDVVPAGLQGNGMAVPLFGWCSCPVGEQLARADDAARAQRDIAERQRAARERALTLEVRRAYDRITSIAADLDRRGTPGRVDRLKEVDVTGWGPFKRVHHDVYESAWPVPDQIFEMYETHTSGGGPTRMPTGVTRYGVLVPIHLFLSGEQPRVLAAKRPRWSGPPNDVMGSSDRTLADLKAVIAALAAKTT